MNVTDCYSNATVARSKQQLAAAELEMLTASIMRFLETSDYGGCFNPEHRAEQAAALHRHRRSSPSQATSATCALHLRLSACAGLRMLHLAFSSRGITLVCSRALSLRMCSCVRKQWDIKYIAPKGQPRVWKSHKSYHDVERVSECE